MILYNDPCDDVGKSVIEWIKRTSNGHSTNDNGVRDSVAANYWGILWTINENSPSLKKQEEESSWVNTKQILKDSLRIK
jgi:hypothetical protein